MMPKAIIEEKSDGKAGVKPIPSLDFGLRSQASRNATFPFRAEMSCGSNSTRHNLQGADLNKADLRWHNFRGASLCSAEMAGSLLWGASLTNADLTNANLCHADLTGSDLAGADLTNAKTDGACFIGARYNQETRFPSNFGDPRSKGCVDMENSTQFCGAH